MLRLVVAGFVVAACGRVGFDPVTSQGDDTQLGDSSVPNGDGLQGSGDGGAGDPDSGSSPIENCMYMNCPGSQEACCAAGNTTCEPAGTCVGVVVPCDLDNNNGCPMFESCCATSTQIYCTPALCML